MHRAKAKQPLSIMEKKIPVNPKYKNTASKIDTGNTINKIRVISHKEYLKRRDETFRRITAKCLVELFQEYEYGSHCSQSIGPEMVARMVKKEDGKMVMERVPATDVDDNQSIASSSSSGPRIVTYDADESEDYDPPYLILDMRTTEEFVVNRIYRSKTFPSSHLNRDQLLPEMHRMKSDESKLIILYDSEEKNAPQAAHTLVQRGFDNIFVLSGGIEEFAENYPEFIEGLPLPGKKKVNGNGSIVGSQRSKTIEVHRSSNTMSSGVSIDGSIRSQSLISKKSRMTNSMKKREKNQSDISSVITTQSVAETVISKATARKAHANGIINYR